MESSDLVHQWWIVAFVDLLGQQDAFLKTDVMPGAQDLAARAELESARRDSLGVIQAFHGFAGQFQEAPDGDEIAPDSPLDGLSAADQAIARRWRRRELRQLNWSDGTVFYAPLSPSPTHFPMLAVLNIVTACGVPTWSTSLGRG